MMNEFQKEIWKNNYKAPTDNTIQDTFLRVATAVAKAEPDKENRQILAKQFYKMMAEWKFIPGGRILANAGVNSHKKATLYNCYVYHPYDFGIRDIDSMQGIFQTLKKSAKILASQGGLGLNLSFIRPNGSYIIGTGARTPGVVKFMELWDKASDVITMGSNKVVNDKFSSKAKKKIRKGAMLCFSENTLILTDNGWEPILQIFDRLQRGQQVNCQYVDGSYHNVKNPIINQPSQIYIVQAKDGTKIECTADHRFQVYNAKTEDIYLKAISDIDPQTQLLTIIDNTCKLIHYSKLKSISIRGVERSYDFQVQDIHRIIAKSPDSENAFLTSNCAIDISHPQIKDFITAKQTSNRLTKFNLSVLVPDRFMRAVAADQMWTLCFPDIQYQNYKEEWDGDLEKWILMGKPIIVYEQLPARQLWDLIMLSAYNRNQPGILFYDIINDYNPVSYCEQILTTNPCLSGDTLIAVADGRNAVAIRELAQQNQDIMVYCLDENGNQDVQYMRNPRITGYNQSIYRITFEDESYLQCTENHIVILRDGTYKAVKQLQLGEELFCVYKKVVSYDKKQVEQYENRCKYLEQNSLQCIAKRTDLQVQYDQTAQELIVFKHCQNCGKVFEVQWNRRQIAFCSKQCGQIYKITHEDLRQKSMQNKRQSNAGIKIKSIDLKPNQVVYNGTVDINHNYGIVIGFDEKDNLKIIYTNQCGQIPQPSNVCNLGSLNLPMFYKHNKFDWQEFQAVIKLAVCFLDDVTDISFVPLNEYEEKIKQKRRIGLGIMGLGSLLMMMKLKFGSHEAIQFVEEVFKFKAQVQLMTSAFLGKMKGSFGVFDRQKYFTSRWWYQLPISYKIKREIENVGQMRNSVHSTVAPTGNCVCGSTKIITNKGIKTLQEILGYNNILVPCDVQRKYLPTQKLLVKTLHGFKEVIGLYSNGIATTYKIYSGKQKLIQGTQEHKLLNPDFAWIKLSQLQKGNKILVDTLDGGVLKEKKITKISLDKNYTYDLQVQDQHHYILSNGVISHNSSIFAGQVSNGIQPVFMKEYTRWVIMTDQQKQILQKRHEDIQLENTKNYNDYEENVETLEISKIIDIPNPQLGQWWQTPVFKFVQRGNEQILRGQIDGVTYEIDKNRGLIKPMQVIDYGWKYVKQNIQSDTYNWCVTTPDLSVQDHINMLVASAKYINQNQSKTINIVKDYSYQAFKNIYISAWRKKIKGITAYRAGTMTAVLEQKKKVQEEQSQLEKLFKGNNGDIVFQDVKLPDKSYALQYKIKDKNKKKWYFTISFADKELTKPFAFFIRTNNRQTTEVADKVIQSMQQLLLSLGVRQELIQAQRQKYKEQTNVDKIGRAIGMALRHNVPIVKIVQTLNNYNDGLSTLLFHIRKILSGFIKDGTKVNNGQCEICGSTQLVYQSGCSTCNNCGGSKCS